MQSIFIGLGVSLGLCLIGLIILGSRFFYPRHRLISLLFLSGAMGLFLIQLFNLRIRLADEERIFINVLSEYGLYMATAIGLMGFYFVFTKFIFRERNPLKSLSTKEIETMIPQDQENILYLNQTLERLVIKSKAWKNLSPSELSDSKAQKLREQWQQFTEAAFELDLIKQRYRAFYRFDVLKNRALHTECFITAYAALISQHKNILALTLNVGKNDNLRTFLNKGQPGLGIAPKVYSHFKYRLTHPKTLIRLNAGRAYLSLLRSTKEPSISLYNLISDGLKYLDSQLTYVPKMLLLNPVEVLEQRAFQSWYPIQAKAAEKISYIRASNSEYLITPKVLKPHLNKFKPGDIMLQRRKWHATNLGIPGFWTHLAFYTGTLTEIDAEFSGLEILNGALPSQYLKEKCPKTFTEMDHKIGRFMPNVIEAKRPGVLVSIVEESALCDSLGILRPSVSKQDKFKAIERAFSYVGKPYDYSFDFRNDKAFLCSEVIYKAYLGAHKFNLDTELVNGRPIFPPNKLAEKFSEQKDDNKELDFVLFLDSYDKSPAVLQGDEASFKASSLRPKWYVLNQYVSYNNQV